MEKIKEYIKDFSQIYIYRDDIDDDGIAGIPLKINNDFLLILYLYDFVFDGYKVLTLDDITEWRGNQIEEFHDYILAQEGTVKNADRLENLNIDSWKNIFGFLQNHQKMIDISLEREEEKRNFFVGKVDEVFEDSIMLREISVTGEYKNRRKRIYYKDITLISFGNRYSEMLDKYGDEYNQRKMG